MVGFLGSDFATADYTSPFTKSYTCHSGSNRRLQVVTDSSVDGLTYDGESLIYEGTCLNFNDPVKYWYLPESLFPATPGAYDLVSTYTTTQIRQIMLIVELDSAQQDSLDRFFCSYTEYANSYSQSTAFNDSFYLLDILLSVNGNTLTAQSSQTTHVNGLTNDGRRWVVGGLSVSTTAPNTIQSNWTQSAATILYSVRLPIRDYSETEFTQKYSLVQRCALADQSGTASTSITATTDDDATADNLLAVYLGVDKDGGSINTPANWNLVGSYNYANGSTSAMFYRIADGTATDNSVQITWNTSEQSVAFIDEWTIDGNGFEYLDGSAGGSAASAVTSISTGSTGTITNVPALVLSCRSVDSNLVTNEFPFVTNNLIAGDYRESLGNYTVQVYGAYGEMLSSAAAETTWSDPAGSSVRMCAIIGVFGETAAAGGPTLNVGMSLDEFTTSFSSNVNLSNDADIKAEENYTSLSLYLMIINNAAFSAEIYEAVSNVSIAIQNQIEILELENNANFPNDIIISNPLQAINDSLETTFNIKILIGQIVSNLINELNTDIEINVNVGNTIPMVVNAVLDELTSDFNSNILLGVLQNQTIDELKTEIENAVLLGLTSDFDGDELNAGFNSDLALTQNTNPTIENLEADFSNDVSLAGGVSGVIEQPQADFDIVLTESTARVISINSSIEEFSASFEIQRDETDIEMIIVEDGSIVENANSYVTVAETRAYATLRGISFPTETAEAEALLIKAMDYIDSRSNYKGVKSYPALQNTSWPRQYVEIDGVEISSAVIPVQLKNAQMKTALEILAGVNPLPTSERGFVKKEVVGPITTEYSEKVSTNTTPYISSVEAILKPLLISGFGVTFKRG